MTYLTVQEVAELARCEHKSVRRAIAAGRIQAFKTGKRFVIREEDAVAWIESSPVIPSVPSPRRARASRRTVERGSVADLREIERKATAA